MSASTITVEYVQEKIGANADPSLPFLDVLNEVCEQYLNSGKWKGSLATVLFSSSTGYITLPRRFQSIVGAQFHNYPVASYPQYHEFMESGFGEYDSALTMGIIQDQGDGWPTQVVQTAVATIRLYPQAADVGDIVRVYGTDINGNVIFGSDGKEGENVTLALPYASPATDMMITGANKPVGDGAVNVYTWDGTTNTQIGSWEPTETTPCYRRYKVGVHETDNPIRCLCQRRYIPLSGNLDIVIPGSIRALKMGLIAVGYENQNNSEDAAKYWNQGYTILNQELRAQRGNSRQPIAFQSWGQRQPSTANAS